MAFSQLTKTGKIRKGTKLYTMLSELQRSLRLIQQYNDDAVSVLSAERGQLFHRLEDARGEAQQEELAVEWVLSDLSGALQALRDVSPHLDAVAEELDELLPSPGRMSSGMWRTPATGL